MAPALASGMALPAAVGAPTAPELDFLGALGGTRTPNLLIRSQML